MTLDRPICPHCGQRMLTRAGVALSPRQADVFDMIQRRGAAGIHIDVLTGVFWPGKGKAAQRNVAKVFINQINARLASTWIRIIVPEKYFYRLKDFEQEGGEAAFVEYETTPPRMRRTGAKRGTRTRRASARK